MERFTTWQSSSTNAVALSRHPLLFALLAAVVAALLCVSLAGPASADDDDDDGGEYVSRQIVVSIVPGASIGAIEKRYRVRMIERLPGGDKIYLVKTRRGVNPTNLAKRMEQDKRVLYAEPNFRAGLPEASRQHRARPGGKPIPSTESAPYRTQYATNDANLNLDTAHQVNEGAGTVVAVIDTGIQVEHSEFGGPSKFTTGYDFVDMDQNPNDVGDGRDNDFDGEADETVGHGTHVAGIVALAAPDAKIMPIRALDTEGRGTTFGIAKAIKFAVRNDADVVNLSLGSSQESDLLEELIGDDDDDAGKTVFVAAAGNDGNSIEQFPAAEEGAIAVASVDSEKKKSDFSNFGRWVTVAAPGTDIHSPFPTSRYATWSGTSMATPFVAGQAALIKSARTSADASCVKDFIERTRDPLTTSDLTHGAMLGGYADFVESVDQASDTTIPCSGGDDD